MWSANGNPKLNKSLAGTAVDEFMKIGGLKDRTDSAILKRDDD